jgi:hypothetical protein
LPSHSRRATSPICSHLIYGRHNIENRIRRYKIRGKLLASRVDKVNKATHGKLIGFCCHWIISFRSKNNMSIEQQL